MKDTEYTECHSFLGRGKFLKLRVSLVQVIVDYYSVEKMRNITKTQFILSLSQSTLETFFIFSATTSKPLFEHSKRLITGRREE